MNDVCSKQKVQEFLDKFKSDVEERGIRFVNRKKFFDTLAELEFLDNDCKEVLKSLEVEDYCKGPELDHSRPANTVFVFGKKCKHLDLYIKISRGEGEDKPYCLSFHEAIHKMCYPHR